MKLWRNPFTYLFLAILLDIVWSQTFEQLPWWAACCIWWQVAEMTKRDRNEWAKVAELAGATITIMSKALQLQKETINGLRNRNGEAPQTPS